MEGLKNEAYVPSDSDTSDAENQNSPKKGQNCEVDLQRMETAEFEQE